MRDEYLWDGSGEPDPEIQKLEAVLGQLRHNRPTPVFSAIPKTDLRQRRWFLMALWPRAIAAAAVLVVAAVLLVVLRPKPVNVAHTGWNVTRVEGAPRVGGRAIASSERARNLGLGQVLETDNTSKASINIEETGEIEVDPGTRLRLLTSGSGIKRVALERGTIHATIWAEPGKFVVNTPSAVAVDLGCVYTLHVDASGDGLLRTTLGWVGFKLGGRESFIPTGAACTTKKKTGPGTPYFEDAPVGFRAALSQFDLPGSSIEECAAALQIVLAQSRQRDALTLWHLLSRVSESDRGRVFDRLTQLVPAPSAVTREGILRLDPQMLDLWWNELGFGDISLWRHWERLWAQAK